MDSDVNNTQLNQRDYYFLLFSGTPYITILTQIITLLTRFSLFCKIFKCIYVCVKKKSLSVPVCAK